MPLLGGVDGDDDRVLDDGEREKNDEEREESKEKGKRKKEKGRVGDGMREWGNGRTLAGVGLFIYKKRGRGVEGRPEQLGAGGCSG